MKYLKRFESIFSTFEDENHEHLTKVGNLLNQLGLKWSIGDDHLGNEGVILFQVSEIPFEIYYVHHECYNLAYKKGGEWDSCKTYDLKKSLDVIIDDTSFLAPEL